MAGRLSNKVSLITGGGRGIGRATALAFGREGGAVCVVDLNGDAAKAVADEVRAAGGKAVGVAANVATAADCQSMVALAEREFGKLNVLFNNAGIMPDPDGSVLDTDEATFDLVMNVNVKGVFFGCKYGIPALLRAGGGSIINTASFVAIMGAATSQSAYTASKGAVLALTREIAVEFARRGIRANSLCPGPVNTPMLQQLLAEPAARARRFVHLPMGRLAEAEEIAEAAVFLASDESSYVNGTSFLVDGGLSGAYVTPE